MKDWKHIHQRIVEHEKSKTHRDSKSKTHRDSADAYFLNVQKADVKSLLTSNQMSLRAEQVKKKRQVIVDAFINPPRGNSMSISISVC